MVVALIPVSALSLPTSGAVQMTDFAPQNDEHSPPLRIELLGALDLDPLAIQVPEITELSGLAWDDDEQLLYAVSDRGHLVHFKPVFGDGRLVDATATAHHPLTNANGGRLTGKSGDAEGLIAMRASNGVRHDTELVISYERRHRINVHKPTGQFVRRVALPGKLANGKNYRSANKGVEAITYHPLHGLMAGPEWPLTSVPEDQIRLYVQNGDHITLPRLNARNAGLVAVEALPDGRLLTLERAHSWLTLSVIIVVKLTAQPALEGITPVTEMARLDSGLGWRVDNFEGLTHHRRQHFFAISDDNGSGLQKTLLLYFRLLPP
jgi:hypothetical protein